MTRSFVMKRIPLITLILILGFSTTALAYRGMGRGHHGRFGMNAGYGWGCNPGNVALSNEDIAKLNEERTTFFNETRQLRQQIYQVRLDFQKALAQDNPDMEQATQLQNQLSNLQAQLNQKWVEHIVRIKKINPNLGPGTMGCGGAGGGYGWGPGKSSGCPYGGGWGY